MPTITCVDNDTINTTIDALADDFPNLSVIATWFASADGRGPVLMNLGDGTYGILAVDDDNLADNCGDLNDWTINRVSALGEGQWGAQLSSFYPGSLSSSLLFMRMTRRAAH